MKTFTQIAIALIVLTAATNAQTFQQKNVPAVPGGASFATAAPPVSTGETRDGDNTLGETYNHVQCGLNYVSSSLMVTTRYSPPGSGLPATLPISGIPPCVSASDILQAYVWWVVSYQSGSSLTPTIDITNPNSQTNSYTASLAGSSGPKCWGEQGTRTFRADVTSNITGNGNYVVNITGNTSWEIDGMTLVIIFRDPFASYQGTLVIYDGCESYAGGTPSTHNITNFTACDSSTAARGFSITSDQQDNISLTHQTTINSTTSTFPNTFWNYDEASTGITANQTSSTFGNIPNPSDCWTWSVIGLYFQTQNCVTCSPPNSLVLSFQNQDATCGNNNGTSTVNVTGGTPPYSYSWSTTPPQTTATATGLGAGTYTVTVTDSSGCFTATASVTINSIGAMNVTTSTVDVLCNAASTGTATITVNSGGTPPYTYLWSTTPAQTTSSASNLSAGTYTVTVTDSVNCSVTSTVIINEPPALSIVFNNFSHTTCGDANGSISPTFSGGTGTYTYLWNNTQTSSSISNLSAGTYTVTVTDSNQCSTSASFVINASAPPTVLTSGNVDICQGNSTTLSASGASTYSWSPATSLSSTTGSSVTANPQSTITYQVIGTDAAGCTDTAFITVTVNPLPFVFTPPAPSICSGGTVNVSVTGADFYHWSPQSGLSNPNGPDSSSVDVTLTSTTTYTVTGFTSEGCSASATITVTVNPDPQPVIAALGNPVFCEGGSVVIEYSNPVTGDVLHWNPNGETTPQITVTQSGIFSLTVTNSFGCSGTSPSITVTVNPNPVATITPAGPVLICTNSPATLTVNTGPGYVYQWFFNGDTIPAATTNQHSNSVTGNYSVNITDGNGCTAASNIVQVVQGTGPTVTIESTPTIGCLENTIYIGYGPQSIELCAQASAGAVSYLWSTGETTQCINVTQPGNYSVIAYDVNGCPSPAPAVLSQPINVIDIRCGHGLKKILLCHVPEGQPGNPQTLCLGPPAIPPHLQLHRYDCLGPCSLYYREDNIIDVESFFVYPKPNPFTSGFTIHILTASSHSITINIHDVLGRIVETYQDVTEATKMGISLNKGVYFAEVIQDDNRKMIQVVKAE